MVKSKKSKKRRLAASQATDVTDLLGTALRATRSRNSNEIPSLYKEDLGEEGVKKKRDDAIVESNFDIRLTRDEKRRRKERKMRFTNCVGQDDEVPAGLFTALSSSRSPPSMKSSGKKTKSNESSVVGTCQNLEKSYLRLTTFPKPEDVRPPEVLVKSLQHIKCRYIRDEDFEWANEQLKSVRQDVTVQGLKNDFVLDVYETHARILLENGDLTEFNQCQTVIRTLTTGFTNGGDSSVGMGLSRKKRCSESLLKQSDLAADEFGGYRLLYALVLNSWSDLTRELAQTSYLIRQDSGNAKGCRHAVLVVKAVTHNDYHGFFRLYESAPHLSAYLMDFLVKRVRASAYERIIAAYRPTISVEYFRESLFFKDMEETREFLRHNGAAFVEPEKGEPAYWVDCKASKC